MSTEVAYKVCDVLRATGTTLTEVIQAYHVLGVNKSPSAKLTADNVRYIRHMVLSWERTQAEMARAFGVSTVTINNIIHRRTWKGVRDEPAVLSPDMVRAIRRAADKGVSIRQIAEASNLAEPVVRSVADRASYGWVKDDPT